MFDKTTIHQSRGPSHITVTENRAPTADTARLLSELEQKAEDRVLGRIKLESNTLNCEVLRMKSFAKMNETFCVTVKLNNERIKLDVETDYDATPEDNLRKIYRAVGDAVAAHIANSIVNVVWR